MIHTHESQQQQLQAFEKACRESGLKVTHQRLMIFRELVLTPDHPTAEQLHQRIRKSIPTISLDTIYRTLATFEEHGLVNRVDTQQSQAHFEAVGTGHHHVICTRCGKILDFKWNTLDSSSLPDMLTKWGRVDTANITAYGICNNCLKQ